MPGWESGANYLSIWMSQPRVVWRHDTCGSVDEPGSWFQERIARHGKIIYAGSLTVQDLAPDRDRLASGSSVTLGAANIIERFAVEGDSGQHVLIVSHAEHVNGMRAVTASMVRQSGGMSQVIQPDVVEHCEPASTSARVE